MDQIQEKILSELRKNISEFEKKLDGDVIVIYGPMGNDLPQALVDSIELLTKSPTKHNSLFILLTTTGGDARTVERVVNIIRHHYKEVNFIVPDYAYSAGTILCMSGDNIYMDYFSILGPIDPQVPNKDGHLVPAQGYLGKIEELMQRARRGELSQAEFLILKDFDLAEISEYEQASELTIELLETWLAKYKFKNWVKTETNGVPVTPEMKSKRAKEIAKILDDHSRWKTHGRPLDINTLESIGLKITDYSKNESLQRMVREFQSFLTNFIDQYKIGALLLIGDKHEQGK